MRLKVFLPLASAALVSMQPLHAQEVRRAIPVEPPVAPAVPFDTPVPTPTPTPTPRPLPPVLQPVPQAPEPAPTPALIQSETPDKEEIDYANSFYARKVYDMAAPEYEKYLGLYPTGPDRQMAYFRLAESYRALGSMNAAKNAYDTLLSTFNDGDFIGPAAYRLADIYFQEMNYDMALPLFRRASVRMTDKAAINAAKFFTARCLESTHSLPEAKTAYDELTGIVDNNQFREASRLALARILTQEGKKVEAHKQYEQIARETDKPEIRIEALVKAAMLKIDLGQTDAAIIDLQKALQQPEIGTWKEIAQIGLMHAYYDSAKYKVLVDFYNQNAKGFSTDALPEVLMMAANASRKLADYTQARALYDQIIKTYPDSSYAADAVYQRLVSLYNADDPALITEIDKFIAANPASDKKDQVLLLKAEALYRKQDYADAAPVYKSLDSTTLPGDLRADAQFKLGWCQMQTKDYANAITSFSDFLAANPKSSLVPAALAQRAVALQKTGDLSSAKKDFDTIVSTWPKAKERELALQQKALLLGQQDDNQGMSDTFKLLLNDYPQTAVAAQANYWIGWAAFKMDDYKNAIAPLDAARKADKDEYYEKATIFIISSLYNLEDRDKSSTDARDKLAAEVDAYAKTNPKIKIPVQVLRGLGTRFLEDKNFEQAEKFLTMLTGRKDEVIADDWLNLGRSLSSQHRYDVAANAFGVYLGSAKEPIPRCTGLLAIGDAQLGLGKFDDAQKSVDEACALQPEGRLNAEGRIMAGEIQMARGSYEAAAKLFLSVSVLLDDPVITPHALELAIEALKKAGKDAEAAKTLNILQTQYAEYLQKKSGGQ